MRSFRNTIGHHERVHNRAHTYKHGCAPSASNLLNAHAQTRCDRNSHRISSLRNSLSEYPGKRIDTHSEEPAHFQMWLVGLVSAGCLGWCLYDGVGLRIASHTCAVFVRHKLCAQSYARSYTMWVYVAGKLFMFNAVACASICEWKAVCRLPFIAWRSYLLNWRQRWCCKLRSVPATECASADAEAALESAAVESVPSSECTPVAWLHYTVGIAPTKQTLFLFTFVAGVMELIMLNTPLRRTYADLTRVRFMICTFVRSLGNTTHKHLL